MKNNFLKLNALKFALAGGVFSGIFVFGATIAGIYGFFLLWANLILDIYGFLGYKINFAGAILGLVYGFIDGFVGLGIFAWLYNKFL